MRVAIKFRNKGCNSKAQLSHLVSLTEICHLCWLPSRGNGAVVQILATHISVLLSVNETQLEALTSVPSGPIPLPRFIYKCIRSVSVTDLSARLWLTGWSGVGHVLVDSRLRQQPKCSGQLLAHLLNTLIVGTPPDHK